MAAEYPDFPTIVAPIAHWGRVRPGKLAASDGTRRFDFATFADAIRQRAAAISRGDGPAIAWVRAGPRSLDQMLEFCAIGASGRAAAIGGADWSETQWRAVQAALPREPFAGCEPAPESPFYVGFTSGTTGVPKGFIRSHRSWAESFRSALVVFGADLTGPVLAPGRLSHSLFLFAAVLGLWTGEGALLQDQFSPAVCLDMMAAGHAACLVGVPSQMLLLLDAAERRGAAPLVGVRLLLIGGARWPRRETPRLRTLFPRARIIEFYGASETSLVTWVDSDPDLPEAVVGRPFPGAELRIGHRADDAEAGLIFVRGPMLFDGYLTGDDGTLARDGDWLAIGDMGRLDGTGQLVLAGRRRRMVVVAGHNVFAEEIELVIERHPAVRAASVIGVPDPLRGETLLAVVQPDGPEPPPIEQLGDHCRRSLPRHKVPRAWRFCENWPRTSSGKTDHARLAALYRP